MTLVRQSLMDLFLLFFSSSWIVIDDLDKTITDMDLFLLPFLFLLELSLMTLEDNHWWTHPNNFWISHEIKVWRSMLMVCLSWIPPPYPYLSVWERTHEKLIYCWITYLWRKVSDHLSLITEALSQIIQVLQVHEFRMKQAWLFGIDVTCFWPSCWSYWAHKCSNGGFMITSTLKLLAPPSDRARKEGKDGQWIPLSATWFEQ